MTNADVSPSTRADAVTRDLRDRILAGDLAPGEPLRETLLEQHYGVSRHTIRRALASLVAERLASARPYSGVAVARLDVDGVVALHELRGALESEAVRLVRSRHGTRWPAAVLGSIEAALDRLEDACTRPDDWLEVERAHSRVHTALVEAAGSERISEAYRALDGELHVFLLHIRPDLDPTTLAADHRDFIDTARMTGADAVRAHLERSTALLTRARAGRTSVGEPGPV